MGAPDGSSPISPGRSPIRSTRSSSRWAATADPQTIPPRPSSPANGAGSLPLAADELGVFLFTDQRGFPRLTGDSLDIGAVQPSYDTITGTAGNDTFTLSGDGQGNVLWQVGSASGYLPPTDPLRSLAINGNGGSDTIVLTSNTTLPPTLQLNGVFTIDGLQSTNFAGTALDIGASTVFITYSGASPLSTIQNYLRNGYNGGGWNGTPTATTGVITSTAAQANHGYMIGYADSADGVISGQPANTIELKYTLGGDLTLAGTVNFADFATIVANSGKPASWDGGAITYDPIVSFADFALLVSNFGKQAVTTTLSASTIGTTSGAATSGTASSTQSSTGLLPAIQPAGSGGSPVAATRATRVPRKRR